MIAVPIPVVEVRRDCPLNDLFLAMRRFESFFDCVAIVNDISLYSFAQELRPRFLENILSRPLRRP